MTTSELSVGSLWQVGPAFLKDKFGTWPTTLAGHRVSAAVPANEVKRTSTTTLAASQLRDQEDEVAAVSVETSRVHAPSRDVAVAIYEAIQDDTTLGKSLGTLARHVLQREKLELSVRVLARVLRAVIGGERQLCTQTPAPRWTEFAILVLVRCSSASARDALKQGRLQGLGVVVRSGVVWVQGRVHGEELSRLLGVSELPVLVSSEPLARSVLRKAHRSDHRRSPQDIAARSRRLAWIVGAGRAAKLTASQCYTCRAKDKRMASQQMGGLPDERTTVLAPFEACALDLFGPYKVRDPANGRRQFKCWVVAFVCLATKAASLLACPGYSTRVFLDVFNFFSGIYGNPRLVYTDHAPSLVKAAETHDWEEISRAVGERGTVWRVTAKGCSWRNGIAERMIRSARHTLAHVLTRGEMLDFHQLSATLSLVASILNSRPLSVRTTTSGDFFAISPRDVLLGRASKSSRSLENELDQLDGFTAEQNLEKVGDAQAKIISEWRTKWLAQVFPDMVPRTKWKQAVRNLRVGDIGVLRYESKLGPDSWRLARVSRADPDRDGLVRTIQIQFRPRHKRDKDKPYQKKVPLTMEIGVQRFAVMLPVEEQGHHVQEEEEDCDSDQSSAVPLASEMTEN